MKLNHPITQREADYPETWSLVSKTDLKGIITYVNRDFIEVSGFNERELLGASHNIVRHPDMPPEAFADLWQTLKSGKPWTGVVKNRCKNGDHYWVIANVTPLKEDGKVTGYMSVRAKPSRAQAEEAEHIYKQLQEKRISSAKVFKKPGLLNRLPLSLKMAFTVVGALALVVTIGMVGLSGMNSANKGLETVYQDRLAASVKLGQINELMRDNIQHLHRAGNHDPRLEESKLHDHPITKHTDIIEKNIATIGTLWENYKDIPHPEETKTLIDKYAESRGKFVREGLKPAVDMYKEGKFAQAGAFVSRTVYPLYQEAKDDAEALLRNEDALAKEEYDRSAQHYAFLQRLMLIIIAAGSVLAVLFGYLLIRSITRPLNTAIGLFDQIAGGDYANAIDVNRDDELGKVLYALKSMQIKLGFDFNESRRVANEALRIKVSLDTSSTNIMIGDTEGLIIYMNKSLEAMFRNAQDDLRKDLPNFDVDKIIGANIDIFHKNPSHQRNLLAGLTASHRATVVVGGHTFRLTATPVVNEEGRRLGTSVEWIDATQEVRIENEIKEIVHAAADGDFSRRLNLDDKEGFTRELSGNINQLLQTSDTGLNEVLRVLGAISSGDLSQKITSEYHGTFGALKDYCNNTVTVLDNIVTQLQNVVSEANRGNFKVSIDGRGMSGFQSEIADGINGLMKTSETGLNEVLRVLAALAKGDLTENITNDYQGTFGQLKDYSNTTVESLKQLIGQIKDAVDSINTASREIAMGNQDLSQRTEEQASSLEETASSMEELTSTVKHNADNAQQASKLAVSASTYATKGGEVVRGSVQTMAEISESSKRIAEIIGVIDGIAFQTNILALNAAVEAARAGEQGRGFAVVAGEVRNLAQRSANAAKEIKELINDSVAKVENGTAQVNEAGNTMEDIVRGVKQVTDIMAEISAASAEQSGGIEQVNQAITQMDEITQQNAALVEQAAAAAESLQEQAEHLAQAVGAFKMEKGSYSARLSLLQDAASKAEEPKPAHAKRPAAQQKRSAVATTDEEEWQEF